MLFYEIFLQMFVIIILRGDCKNWYTSFSDIIDIANYLILYKSNRRIYSYKYQTYNKKKHERLPEKFDCDVAYWFNLTEIRMLWLLIIQRMDSTFKLGFWKNLKRSPLVMLWFRNWNSMFISKLFSVCNPEESWNRCKLDKRSNISIRVFQTSHRWHFECSEFSFECRVIVGVFITPQSHSAYFLRQVSAEHFVGTWTSVALSWLVVQLGRHYRCTTGFWNSLPKEIR